MKNKLIVLSFFILFGIGYEVQAANSAAAAEMPSFSLGRSSSKKATRNGSAQTGNQSLSNEGVMDPIQLEDARRGQEIANTVKALDKQARRLGFKPGTLDYYEEIQKQTEELLRQKIEEQKRRKCINLYGNQKPPNLGGPTKKEKELVKDFKEKLQSYERFQEELEEEKLRKALLEQLKEEQLRKELAERTLKEHKPHYSIPAGVLRPTPSRPTKTVTQSNQ